MVSSDQPPASTAGASLLTDRGMAGVVYALYLIGFITVVTAVAGVIIAHLKVRHSENTLATHFQFQVRTFWIGLLYFALGWVLLYVVIGAPMLIWWFVWTLVRLIKGIILLNDRSPISRPRSWLFG
jgi:uncharacterized membrane protein